MQAITLSAFLYACRPVLSVIRTYLWFRFLLIEYASATASGHSTDLVLERKDKMPLPIPVCCYPSLVVPEFQPDKL